MKLGQAARFAKGEDWIISRYEEWLAHGRDMRAERDALHRILSRPERIRTGTFSASGASTCLRKRQFEYLGIDKKPFSKETQNILANGDYVHLRHQVAGLVGGYLDDVEVSLRKDELKLTGTADGVTTDKEFVEYKSIHANGFDSVSTFGVREDHEYQVNSYLYLGDYESALVVYENKNTQRLKEYRVYRDEQKIRRIVEDLEVLNEYTNDRKLVPVKSACASRTGAYKTCPFAPLCLEARSEDMPWDQG